MNGPVLRVSELRKTFRPRGGRRAAPVNAVDGVTLTLQPCERVGIIGASGCGKTTLLRLILGLTKPTSGVIEKNAPAGFVAQDPYSSLCSAMTVAEIIAEPLIFTGKARRASDCVDEIRRVLELVRLPEAYAARYPHELSGGERQRVSIARAMIVRPGFLALDEPTSMIDFDIKSGISDVIKGTAEMTGTAVLLVTHDISSARGLCDTICVMNAGKIIESGPAEEIMQNPREEYTKRLILAGGDLEAYWRELDGYGTM